MVGLRHIAEVGSPSFNRIAGGTFLTMRIESASMILAADYFASNMSSVSIIAAA